MKFALNSFTPWEQEFRILDSKGNIKWLRAASTQKKQRTHRCGMDTCKILPKERSLNTDNYFEEKFRSLFDYTSDAVVLYTQNGIMDCNPATLRLLGVSSKNELIGKHPIDFSNFNLMV
jgi:PAS domain-containing protein